MASHRICRFRLGKSEPRIGLVTEQGVADLTDGGVANLHDLWSQKDLAAHLDKISAAASRTHRLVEVTLLAPVDSQEVWAAGVTYLRSKTARMEESEFSASAYDRVYAAERPEIFFKSVADKVVGPGDLVGIRKDATWNVPEPELALVINREAQLVGYTIGNDMSSRDIEGENLLYLPQAKVYKNSCALGPWVTLATEAEARQWEILIEIIRGEAAMFQGETAVSQIKRSFDELIEFLFRSQEFPNGAVLLTGTGVVPPDNFTLNEGDTVRITISGIGELQNRVVQV